MVQSLYFISFFLFWVFSEQLVQQITLYRIYYKYLLLTASIIHDLLKLPLTVQPKTYPDKLINSYARQPTKKQKTIQQ